MNSKAMRLKGKLKNYAKSNHIAAQVVLQNYMFECLLSRLSVSVYCDKFVVKGGMLIAAVVGLDIRSTMDLDTTLRDLPLTEEQIAEAFNEICKIGKDDDVVFTVKSIAPIRKDDEYGGYRVRLDAEYDTILTPLSIDVEQALFEHLRNTAELAGKFADCFHCRDWGYACGLMHDIGKYSAEFQRRIRGENFSVDHSSPPLKLLDKKEDAFAVPFFIRMIYSCPMRECGLKCRNVLCRKIG